MFSSPKPYLWGNTISFMPSPIDIPLLAFEEFLQTRTRQDQRQIFDPIRRKWVALTPEELVRQLLVQYLIRERQYSPNRIGVEKMLKVNTLTRRFDLLVYDPGMAPWMLIECKAPAVPVSQATFDQVARYNLPLRVPYLAVSNGRDTYCCAMDYERADYTFLPALPDFPK